MSKIKGWRKISNGHLNNLYEWENIKTKQRVMYHPYFLTEKYELVIETRDGVKKGVVSNKYSANFGAMNYMRSHPNG